MSQNENPETQAAVVQQPITRFLVSRDQTARNTYMNQVNVHKRRLSFIVELKEIVSNSIKSEFIRVGPMKNKDLSAWSTPKDPLTRRIEEFKQTISNIYHENLFQHTYVEVQK